jgi:DNA-binding FadR family transcriptional regulator
MGLVEVRASSGIYVLEPSKAQIFSLSPTKPSRSKVTPKVASSTNSQARAAKTTTAKATASKASPAQSPAKTRASKPKSVRTPKAHKSNSEPQALSAAQVFESCKALEASIDSSLSKEQLSGLAKALKTLKKANPAELDTLDKSFHRLLLRDDKNTQKTFEDVWEKRLELNLWKQLDEAGSAKKVHKTLVKSYSSVVKALESNKLNKAQKALAKANDALLKALNDLS